MIKIICILGALAVSHTAAAAAEPAGSGGSTPPSFRVPPGLVVEKVASQPLVQYPLFACFDDRGRLYVAEGTGKNLPGAELVKLKLGKITRLEDTDGDGRFDTSKTFSDELVFPQGVLWFDGAVYVASHPSVWRLEDTDGDGQADRREELIGKFGFNGNGCDLHGPFAGPDGWLYWTDGRHGYKIETREGERLEGLASRIWRCKPDGSRIERICGGAFDNPVELAFTAGADLVGTMDQGSGDCLLHYVAGGVYPRDDHPSINEFIRTGPLLQPITSFGAAFPVALCGLLRIRTDYLGSGFKDTLLTTQFNVHRLQQHELIHDGATYRCASKDFLVASSYDFHPTDVLEDADGSLLVIDMGAWFNYGCPTSKIAKPEIKGAIYRIRRADATAVPDPWGQKIDFTALAPERLAQLLGDLRIKVREQAANRLVKLGGKAVPALRQVCRREGVLPNESTARAEQRPHALWVLSRIDTPESRAAVREALADPDATVRSIAAHCVGLERDTNARPALLQMVVSDEPPLRLKAAEALGRLGGPEAVPALIESLRRGSVDRFLEHALIFALIYIGDQPSTLPALNDPNPNVRRASLIALDQMKNGGLTRELVTPLLNTDDPLLQQAALDVISKREGWAHEIIKLVESWLAAEQLTANQQGSMIGALIAFSSDPAVQVLVRDALRQARTPLQNKRLLLQVLSRCRLDQLPASWHEVLNNIFTGSDNALQRDAIAVVRARRLSASDVQLVELSARADAPADLRIAALDCFAPRANSLDEPAWNLLTSHLGDRTDPLLRVMAARALGRFRLNSKQLLELARQIAQAGPLIVPLLVPAYAPSAEAEPGLALIKALNESPGIDALTADELRTSIRRCPPEVQAAAESLLGKLGKSEREQEAYLVELNNRVLQTPGDPQRGRQVFFSGKVGCAGCHTIDSKGGNAGPDLSQVGRFRDPRALLEAVVFPSATIVPDYRSYSIETLEGESVEGMIVRETAEDIHLRTAQLAEVRLARRNVKSIRPSNISLMPQGLEKIMTNQELTDLLEFLFQRR